MVDSSVSTLLNQGVNDATNRQPPPELPGPDADPLAYAKAVHELEDWLRGESKIADEAAWRYGKQHGMTETAIGAATGRTAQHVYKVRKRIENARKGGESQE